MAVDEQTHFDELLLNGSLLVLTLFNRSCGFSKLPCSRSCVYRQHDRQCRFYGVRFGWRAWSFDDPIGHRATIRSRRWRARGTYG